MMRRTAWVVGGVLAAVVFIGGGWLAAGAFTSPEQSAAQAAAPPPTPILARVTQGDLIDERTIGATVVPTSTAIATLASVDGAARTVVTTSDLSPGATVTTGEVLLRVNGEPVFAVASPFPLYRDIGVGDSGADVRVLQENLKDLGLLDTVDGEFGAQTAVAVATLYRGAQSSAPTRAAESTDTAGQPADVPPAEPAPEIYLPLSAIAAVPELPATLASSPAVGADLADGATLTFSATTALLRLPVPVELAGVLVTGVELVCAVGDEPDAPCRVESVYDATAAAADFEGGDEVMTWADVAPVDAALSAEQTDERANVRIRVATLAEDALLVPVVAVAQHGTDSGTVLLQRNGSFHAVDVRILAILDGKAAISGGLRAGDRLRVDQ